MSRKLRARPHLEILSGKLRAQPHLERRLLLRLLHVGLSPLAPRGATLRSGLKKGGERSARNYSCRLYTQILQPPAGKISRCVINSELYWQ